MKKTDKSSKLKQLFFNRKIVGCAVVLAVLLVALLIFRGVSHYNDRIWFSSVEKKQSLVSSRLIEYLGTNVSSSKKENICFRTEQGPYDNGRLWCQVTTIIGLKLDVDQE